MKLAQRVSRNFSRIAKRGALAVAAGAAALNLATAAPSSQGCGNVTTPKPQEVVQQVEQPVSHRRALTPEEERRQAELVEAWESYIANAFLNQVVGIELGVSRRPTSVWECPVYYAGLIDDAQISFVVPLTSLFTTCGEMNLRLLNLTGFASKGTAMGDWYDVEQGNMWLGSFKDEIKSLGGGLRFANLGRIRGIWPNYSWTSYNLELGGLVAFQTAEAEYGGQRLQPQGKSGSGMYFKGGLFHLTPKRLVSLSGGYRSVELYAPMPQEIEVRRDWELRAAVESEHLGLEGMLRSHTQGIVGEPVRERLEFDVGALYYFHPVSGVQIGLGPSLRRIETNEIKPGIMVGFRGKLGKVLLGYVYDNDIGGGYITLSSPMIRW